MATLAQSRLAACDKRKYATYQILSLVPVCKPGLGTMAVDSHWRLYYDPAFLDGLSIEQAAGVILHESAHLLFGHAERAKMHGINDATHQNWNVACDCAINDILVAEGVELPPDGCFPSKFGFPGGKSAETYYELLTKKQQDEQQAAQQAQQGDENEDESESTEGGSDASDDEQDSQEGDSEGETKDDNQQEQGSDGDDDGQQGSEADAESGEDDDSESESASGDSPGDGGEQGSDDSATGDAEQSTGGRSDRLEQGDGGDSEGLGSQEQAVAKPGEGGSCSDGIQRPWEDDPPADDDSDVPPDGDNPEPRGVPEWEQKVILQQVANAAEKFKGDLPGAMQEALDQILNPRVDPRKLLMRAVRAHSDNIVQTGAGRFTYRRPSRRPGFGGTVRPSSFAPLPRITVIIDTSGSMDQRDLGMAVGLVANVLNGLRLRDGLRVVCADADLQWTGKVFDPSKIELCGRGGTDMRQAIVDVIANAKRDERPELIVVVSDGETDWPPKSVGIPVVACITRKSRFYPVPSWMQTVYMKGE